MTRDCMLWLNLPHVVSQALMVIGVLVVSMWMHTGLIQQTEIETLCEYMTDESWANWDGTDCLEPSSCPYYCMCKRWDGAEWETLENGKKPFAIDLDGNDNWVTRDRAGIYRADFHSYDENTGVVNRDDHMLNRTVQEPGWTVDEWINRQKYDIVFRTNNVPPWPLSTMVTGESMHVSEGVQIAAGYTAAGELPPDGALREEFLEFKRTAERLDEGNCMMEGLTLGRSVSFITAVMCEMLRAYTVRSLAPVTEVWNRNNIMHLACASSFLLTVSLTFIPGVKDLFKLGTPMWFYYGVAFIFALGSLTIDEISKWAFRRVLVQREAGDKGALERKDILDRVDMVVERLQDIERGVGRNNETGLETIKQIKAANKAAGI